MRFSVNAKDGRRFVGACRFRCSRSRPDRWQGLAAPRFFHHSMGLELVGAYVFLFQFALLHTVSGIHLCVDQSLELRTNRRACAKAQGAASRKTASTGPPAQKGLRRSHPFFLFKSSQPHAADARGSSFGALTHPQHQPPIELPGRTITVAVATVRTLPSWSFFCLIARKRGCLATGIEQDGSSVSPRSRARAYPTDHFVIAYQPRRATAKHVASVFRGCDRTL